MMFYRPSSPDAATMKTAFCKRLDSEEGFQTVCREDAQPPTSLEDGAAYCGKDPDAMPKVLPGPDGLYPYAIPGKTVAV